MPEQEVSLRVQEPDPGHVGRNIITLDRKTKQLLGVTSGDIVEIEGEKKTAALIWPARDEDEGHEIIRMDNLIRKNCGTNLGERVVVRKAKAGEGKKVVLAPTQDIRIIASGYERILKKNFIGRPLTKGDDVWISVFGSGFVYTVVDTLPKGTVKVNDFTQFVLKEEPVAEVIGNIPKIAYEDIGGIDEQIRKIREMIELPMRHPELFRKLGITPPKGVLLHGAPGTGKTLLAKAVAHETNANFIPVNSTEMLGKYVGEAEERIRNVFKDAEDNSPSIVFFDEIDAIAPKRDEVIGEVEKRVVTQILSSMDGLKARGNVIVIAATNRVDSLDEALRRPGRFDREVEIGVPDEKGRKQILQIHSRGMPLAEDVDLNYLASITYGFVGADLESLTKESAMKALRRYLPQINLDEEKIPAEVLESLVVKKEDFLEALKEVQPSALREVAIEVPNVKWGDVGGLKKAKEELIQAIEWPLKKPHYFSSLGIKPPKGILLFGPPGTGKTLLVKAIATESQANFISVKGPELTSMWVGESEKGIRKVFKRARQVSPCVLFFDEIESIAKRRGAEASLAANDRMVDQLLTELGGIDSQRDLIFIAATNRPDLIDPALLCPGRIDKMILVPAPDEGERKEIFLIHLRDVPLDEKKKKEIAEELASITKGFSGADIEKIVRETALKKLLSPESRKKLDDFAMLSDKEAEIESKLKELKSNSIRIESQMKSFEKKLENGETEAGEKAELIQRMNLLQSRLNEDKMEFNKLRSGLEQAKEKKSKFRKPSLEISDFREMLTEMSPSIDGNSEKAYSEFELHSKEFRPNYIT